MWVFFSVHVTQGTFPPAGVLKDSVFVKLRKVQSNLPECHYLNDEQRNPSSLFSESRNLGSRDQCISPCFTTKETLPVIFSCLQMGGKRAGFLFQVPLYASLLCKKTLFLLYTELYSYLHCDSQARLWDMPIGPLLWHFKGKRLLLILFGIHL